MKRNMVECALCHKQVYSVHIHDFRSHQCYVVGMGASRVASFFVDGGLNYARRGWGGPGMSSNPADHFIERSIP